MTTNLRTFQTRAVNWAKECFGLGDVHNREMRVHRFLEEAVELAQAGGCDRETAIRIVDYVYGRKPGELPMEVGGTMMTLAVLCEAYGMSLENLAENELDRVLGMVDAIRQRHASKPDFTKSLICEHGIPRKFCTAVHKD